MSDDDLIRRGDALAAVKAHDFRWEAADAIAALPARGVGVKSDAAEMLAKEMQAIVAADRWKGRDLNSAPPEKWSHLRPETQQFWIDTATRILAALSATDAAQARPAWLSNCVVCGRIVDTRETDEGGDGHGCEYAEGWTCSSDCAERLHPDPDWMKEGLAAQAREAALIEAALKWREAQSALNTFEAENPGNTTKRWVNLMRDKERAEEVFWNAIALIGEVRT